MFVDDNENIRQMIIETLKDSFKNLYIASNGKEALQIILKEIPDIVISDIMMPEMNGYELCRKIKEDMNINHIQVILLTARTDEQSHLDGYKTGADAYMEKPFEINSLLENVRNRLYLREQIKLKYTHSVISDTEKPATSADDTFIFKLNKVIIENMENEGLNVDLISQELGISRASLYNRLKALTGMGANEYVNKLRIEKAMELLRQTELNMTEIAEHTGFSTSRYFSTAFKNIQALLQPNIRRILTHSTIDPTNKIFCIFAQIQLVAEFYEKIYHSSFKPFVAGCMWQSTTKVSANDPNSKH